VDEEDKEALDRHFIRFQEATKSGQLILAGRHKSRVIRHLHCVFRHPMKAARVHESRSHRLGQLMTAELHPSRWRLNTRLPNGNPNGFITCRTRATFADGTNWKKGYAALERHVIRFKRQIGQLIWRGRTKSQVIRHLASRSLGHPMKRPRAFMKADPTVSAGLMTAELHPSRWR
jgi:hypothetical protein